MGKQEYRYIGKPVPRMDIDKVSGEAVFAYDFELPGMLWVKLVGSPYPHARIKRIKTDEAAKVPGVVAVLTGKDFPVRVGMHLSDRDVLAQEKALYVGHPVAAVVAETLDAAEKAAELIEVEYEPLPAVLDIEEAIKPDAPVLHPDLDKYRRLPSVKPVPGTNIANVFKLRKGNIEEGMSKADVVVEHEYKLPMLHHGYLEPWCCVARVQRDGTIEIWSSTQGPFAVRQQLAYSLGIPQTKILVHYLYVGGGFGGKADLHLEYIPVLISMKLGGKPVKLLLNREEVFHYCYHRGEYLLKMKTGATKDGKLVAHWGEYYYGTGCFADLGLLLGNTVGFLATGPYDIPHVYIDSYTVYTNKPATTAFRNYTHSELHFAFEQQLDELARKLGMDPVEFRLKNIWKPGVSTTPTGQRLREDMGAPAETLKRAAELIEWGKPPEQPKEPWKIRVKGIAVGPKGPSFPSNAASSAIVKLNEDGGVDVITGVAEMGQGTSTAFAQIVAEELGIPVEKVRVYGISRDTANTPYDWETCASRALYAIGIAVRRAVADLKTQIRKVAAQALRVPEDEIEIDGGKAYVKGAPWYYVELKDLALGYTFPDGRAVHGPIIGRGAYIPDLCTALDELGRGNAFPFITFVSFAVELEIDLLTGRITVPKAVAVSDTPIINPILALGQAYGGAGMGINIALREEIKFDKNGRILNPNFTDYKLARIKDVPEEIKVEFLGYGQSDAPYGAKGIAESFLNWWAVIACGLGHLLGSPVEKLPLTPDYVLKLIKERRPDLLKRVEEAVKIS